MDIKYAKQLVKNDNINAKSYAFINSQMPELLKMFEPYRRFKRFNKTHAEEISAKMKETFGAGWQKEGLKYVTFGKRPYFEGQYELRVHYARMSAERWSEPSIENSSYDIRVEGELSGENVYAALRDRKLYDPSYPSVEEMDAFFERLQAFCDSEPLSKYGLEKAFYRY